MVSWHPGDGKWKGDLGASRLTGDKRQYLGSFDEEEDAKLAVAVARSVRKKKKKLPRKKETLPRKKGTLPRKKRKKETLPRKKYKKETVPRKKYKKRKKETVTQE